MLQLFKNYSNTSDSYASQGFRDYIDTIARVHSMHPDIVPRFVDVQPIVDENGHMNTKFVDPFLTGGRITSSKG